MKRSDFLSVVILFVGLLMLLLGLVRVPQAILRIQYYSTVVMQDGSPYPISLSYCVLELSYPVVYLAVGVVMLFRGESIAQRLVRNDRAINWTASRDWERSLFVLAVRGIGVYWLVAHVPFVFSSFIARVWERAAYPYPAPGWAKTIGGVLVLAVGVYLITGAKHLVRALYGPAQEEQVDPTAEGMT